MFLYPTAANNRQLATEIFNTLLMQAFLDSFLEKLNGRQQGLLSFPGKTKANISNRKLLGVLEIPVEKVIGTLGRSCDFDASFRPVKKHLRDRWVNVFMSLEADKWPPILVHKIGEVYYVEDGHHRISVARSMGRAFIAAEVWEYSIDSPRDIICGPRASCSASKCPSLETCPA
jgi:hypothetical protein